MAKNAFKSLGQSPAQEPEVYLRSGLSSVSSEIIDKGVSDPTPLFQLGWFGHCNV